MVWDQLVYFLSFYGIYRMGVIIKGQHVFWCTTNVTKYLPILGKIFFINSSQSVQTRWVGIMWQVLIRGIYCMGSNKKRTTCFLVYDKWDKEFVHIGQNFLQ